MARPNVTPAQLRRAAEPGQTVLTSVSIDQAPSGADVTASIVGGDSAFRVRGLRTGIRVQMAFTPEEIDELPRTQRERARRTGYKETVETGRSDGANPLRVQRGNWIAVDLELSAPQSGTPDSSDATLMIDGTAWDRVEVPLALVIAKLDVRLASDTVVVRKLQSEDILADVISIAGADTHVHFALSSDDGQWRILTPDVGVARGATVSTRLKVFADTKAPEGTFPVGINITAYDGLYFRFVPLNIQVLPPIPPAELAERAIDVFHRNTMGALIVGSPTGEPIQSHSDGSFTKVYRFGTITKPKNGDPGYSARYAVSIAIAAVRCFGTEDPSGEDEPYLNLTIYALDPAEREDSVRTLRIGPEEIGPIDPDDAPLFLQGRQVTDSAFFVPGDGSVRMKVALWDREHGNPEDNRSKQHDAAKAGIAAGLARINPAIPVAAEAVGLLDAAADVATDVINALIGDDLIGQRDFNIDTNFLFNVSRTPSQMKRISASIPGIDYNFPTLKEDDSVEGKSWLFSGGGGSYRVFFNVRAAPVSFRV